MAFLDSTSFEDAIRLAISIGGDSDTIAAMCGPIAEAYYGIPESIAVKSFEYLNERFMAVLSNEYPNGSTIKDLIMRYKGKNRII